MNTFLLMPGRFIITFNDPFSGLRALFARLHWKIAGPKGLIFI